MTGIILLYYSNRMAEEYYEKQYSAG